MKSRTHHGSKLELLEELGSDPRALVRCKVQMGGGDWREMMIQADDIVDFRRSANVAPEQADPNDLL